MICYIIFVWLRHEPDLLAADVDNWIFPHFLFLSIKKTCQYSWFMLPYNQAFTGTTFFFEYLKSVCWLRG